MESHACRSPSLELRHGLGKWQSFYMTARMSPGGEKKNYPYRKLVLREERAGRQPSSTTRDGVNGCA